MYIYKIEKRKRMCTMKPRNQIIELACLEQSLLNKQTTMAGLVFLNGLNL